MWHTLPHPKNDGFITNKHETGGFVAFYCFLAHVKEFVAHGACCTRCTSACAQIDSKLAEFQYMTFLKEFIATTLLGVWYGYMHETMGTMESG